jgi:hypothetical protein
MQTTSATLPTPDKPTNSAIRANPIVAKSPMSATTTNLWKFLPFMFAEKLHRVLAKYENIVATINATIFATTGPATSDGIPRKKPSKQRIAIKI